MRIISGSAGGQTLLVPKSLTRPTTDRVRGAIFSTLGDLVPGARVLDLFAGSGALGIEALSRGASRARFVETSAEAARTIEENLRRTKLPGGEVHRREVLAFLHSLPPGSCDLVFADPPYARDAESAALLQSLLESEALAAGLAPGGVLVLESHAPAALPETALKELWETSKEKRYGDTRVSYLRPRKCFENEAQRRQSP